MSIWNLKKISEIVEGTLIGDSGVIPKGISHNSTQIKKDECFIALRANRDGHNFIDDAIKNGASCLIVDHLFDAGVPQIIVADTTQAMHKWGQTRLEAYRPSCVFGVTGSNGKTTTKEFLSAMVGAWKTPGNFNNTIGLPLSLAFLPDNTGAAVLEMGMSTPGEIRKLTEIAPLDFGIITNIGHAHIENFSKGIKGITRAKGELIEGIRSGGSWVFPEDDLNCRWISEQSWARHTSALSIGPKSSRKILNHEPKGLLGESFVYCDSNHELKVDIQLKGQHHVMNAALAIAIAIESGFNVQQIVLGAHSIIPELGRGRVHHLAKGGYLLDESYNASPESIIATADCLRRIPGGELVAVLGSIRELGQSAEFHHQHVGAQLKQLGFEHLLCYGDYGNDFAKGFGVGSVSFPSYEELRDGLGGLCSIPIGARILVKGSRYWKCDQVVEWILSSNLTTIKTS